MLKKRFKPQLSFALLVSILTCGQIALAASYPASVLSYTGTKQKKKPQKRDKGFFCGTAMVNRIVSAESELVYEQPAPAGLIYGQAVRKVEPGYPTQAIVEKAQGRIVVDAVVSPTGEVTSVRPVTGHPALSKASAEAAKGWRFTPTTVNGVPVELIARITFSYDLGLPDKMQQDPVRK